MCQKIPVYTFLSQQQPAAPSIRIVSICLYQQQAREENIS